MTRWSALAILLATSMAVGGCTIWNAPDPSRLDGGVDAFVDLDAADASVDAEASVDASGDAHDANRDANPCSFGPEVCGNREDEDCDDLVDCADPDCVEDRAPECCDSGLATTISDNFNEDTWSAVWQRPGALPSATLDALQNFGSGDLVGMVRQDMGRAACLEAELGSSISFDLRAETCSAATCEGFTEVVLGPSSEFRVGGELLVDLGIRATSVLGNLTVEVVRGKDVVASRAGLGVATVPVVISLALGVVETPTGPRAAIVADVTVAEVALIENVLVLFRDEVRFDRCAGVFLGIQGTGSFIRLDTLSISQLDCSNPARLDTSDMIPQMTATTFSALDWASGGIGSPAILARPEGAPSQQLMVLFDGSGTDRGSVGLGRLPLRIGGGDLASGTVMTANCDGWLARASDNATDCPTSAPLITALPRVMRDPAMIASGTDVVRVLWVGEPMGGSHDLGLYTGLLDLSASRTTTLTAGTALPIMDESCASIRNPQLVPLVGSTPPEFLLFYVCTDRVAEVHIARGTLTASGLRRVSGAGGVLGPTELGAVAINGVSDVAAAVFTYGGRPTYRLWLLTHSAGGAVLSFAEGSAAAGDIPTFVPYAGNPILFASDLDLGPCLGECELHGVAATRSSDTEVRLLIERWDSGSATAPYALIPLRQAWPSDL